MQNAQKQYIILKIDYIGLHTNNTYEFTIILKLG